MARIAVHSKFSLSFKMFFDSLFSTMNVIFLVGGRGINVFAISLKILLVIVWSFFYFDVLVDYVLEVHALLDCITTEFHAFFFLTTKSLLICFFPLLT